MSNPRWQDQYRELKATDPEGYAFAVRVGTLVNFEVTRLHEVDDRLGALGGNVEHMVVSYLLGVARRLSEDEKAVGR